MTLLFVRIFFVILSAIIGYYLGSFLEQPVLGIQLGCLSGLVLILIEQKLRRVSVRGLSSMVFGLVLGLVIAKLLSDILALIPLGEFVHSTLKVVLTVVFSYLGAVMALRGKDEFNVIIPYIRFQRQDVYETVILLDTSAIIDGRLSDIYKANFLAGRLVAPSFVLNELQKLSDSADNLKRQRGRRGMEILKSMQDDPKMDVRIHEDDLDKSLGVDARLIELAKMMKAEICTTDYNLSQVASLQGLKVLNLSELSHAVKPVIRAGEELDVELIRKGKEPRQAVGYLEDGTMIVVSDAENKVGHRVSAIVTSVLQTHAGKIIFARLNVGSV